MNQHHEQFIANSLESIHKQIGSPSFNESLLSFPKNFKDNNQINIKDLVEAGFTYNPRLKVSECKSCQYRVNIWNEGMNPMKEHVKFSPKCPFKSVVGKRNLIDIGEEKLTIYFLYHDAILDKLSKITAAYHNFLQREWKSRITSFYTWPYIFSKPHVIHLVEAGFYYTGKEDLTRCFCCGICMKNWEASDNPWEYHALHSQLCNFVDFCKGKIYIEKIFRKYNKSMAFPPDLTVDQLSSFWSSKN